MALPLRARAGGRHRADNVAARLHAENNELVCKLVKQATQIGALTAQLDEAGIELSGARLELAHAAETITALRAELANARAVTVPPMVRDTSAIEDQATGPIDVQHRFEGGPVRRLGADHRPSWARNDGESAA